MVWALGNSNEHLSIFFYSQENSGESVSDCKLCDLGHYCNGTGRTSFSDVCDPGYFCQRGANLPKPNNDSTGGICPKGHFCEAGKQPQECGPGKTSTVQYSSKWVSKKQQPENSKDLRPRTPAKFQKLRPKTPTTSQKIDWQFYFITGWNVYVCEFDWWILIDSSNFQIFRGFSRF